MSMSGVSMCRVVWEWGGGRGGLVASHAYLEDTIAIKIFFQSTNIDKSLTYYLCRDACCCIKYLMSSAHTKSLYGYLRKSQNHLRENELEH